MKKLTAVALFAVVILTSIPTLSVAKNLGIYNNTRSSFSVSINHRCSNEFGTIEMHSTQMVKEKYLIELCKVNKYNCEAILYKGDACTGMQLAVFNFDATKKVKEWSYVAKGYYLAADYPNNTVWLSERV